MVKTRNVLKEKLAERIQAGGTDKVLSDYIVNGSGKLKADKIAQETIKQGFDQGVVAAIKGASAADKTKMASMVKIMEKIKFCCKLPCK